MNNLLPGFVDSLPVRPEIVPTIPMQRYASVAEIAKVAAFLLGAGRELRHGTEPARRRRAHTVGVTRPSACAACSRSRSSRSPPR